MHYVDVGPSGFKEENFTESYNREELKIRYQIYFKMTSPENRETDTNFFFTNKKVCPKLHNSRWSSSCSGPSVDVSASNNLDKVSVDLIHGSPENTHNALYLTKECYC